MFNDSEWAEYIETYRSLLSDSSIVEKISSIAELINSCSQNGGTILFFGNGASASLASHAALDFTKQAKVKSQVFHDPSYITAISNDAGYDNWIDVTLGLYARPQDCCVFISVSGESECIIRGAQKAKSLGIPVIAFTGKNPNNSLQAIANQTLHIPSDAYNIVEGMHSILLTGCVDSVIGESVYSVDL